METFNHTRQRTISLRPYQQEALIAIADAESRGIRRQLVALPTGTGKTVIFAHLLQQRIARDRYQTIIIDKCHHATADSYCRVLEYFTAFSPCVPLAVGFTATPERADEQELGEVFQEIAYRRDIESMIREDYLCDLHALQVKVAVDNGSLHTKAGITTRRSWELHCKRRMCPSMSPPHIWSTRQTDLDAIPTEDCAGRKHP